MNEFVNSEPWFAGWCAVMVNLSDILAMGGRATGLTNAIWAPDENCAKKILKGMREASESYGVPILGGHTNLKTDRPQLAQLFLKSSKFDYQLQSFPWRNSDCGH